jgi:hypothetical protein
MASTINAKTTGVGGIDASGDASGVLALQTGGTTAVTIDASQNVTLAKGLTVGATAAPAFSAYVSVATTNIASATGVTVPYDTKLFDTASRYNNTASTVGGIPAYSFMPNVAGYYQVSGSCNYEASNGTTRVLFNTAGASSNRLQDLSASGTVISGTVSGSTLVYFNGTTDYISMTTYQAGTGQQRIQGGAGAVTWFTAFLARSA